MHVGFAPVFMNTSGAMSDLECFKHELALADLAEPLGFDSIWQPEHHFSGYEMTPNVLQFLTYMAGRTKTVRLGSMVVVLPWHNPLRVVEDVTQLDYYSGGRAILGFLLTDSAAREIEALDLTAWAPRLPQRTLFIISEALDSHAILRRALAGQTFEQVTSIAPWIENLNSAGVLPIDVLRRVAEWLA